MPEFLPTIASGQSNLRDMVRIKAQILEHGVAPDRNFLENYGAPNLLKRRAYGNPDDLEYLNVDLPQELRLHDEVIVGAAARSGSPWTLSRSPDGQNYVQHASLGRVDVSFSAQPQFYEQRTVSGQPVNSIVTLYGGGALGIFAYGNCALVDMNAACQYCSISANRSKGDEFQFAVSAKQVREALDVALADEATPVKQVMLNGGNFSDTDKSFLHYVTLVSAAREAIDAAGRDVELHLIVYPPHDYRLLHRLSDYDVHLAMNTEVHDPELFAKYCPGKEVLGGQRHLRRGLEEAVLALGPGQVYSIFVGGLESVESLTDGLTLSAEMGVIPVINVLHADPGTPLAEHPEPSAQQIIEMGAALEKTYADHSFCRSFYAGVGRNSLDHEAHLRLFS
ncbi:radical SAM protein [Rhodococcus erythropolis]|uniref:radical SAM protein n=1 Tax=Rhodococcus erythropolis TaxID=1833 RepID=UPI001BECEB90|nr:radical SAM protein [Rhodococcus erythropolis]MBT2269025.1 hypothetical protein [Rhodococcus erythropolis]